MPRPSHDLIQSVRMSLHYRRLPDPGICAGLVQMGIQAFLSGEKEFKRYSERLEFIASHPDFFADEDSLFNRTRNKVLNRLQEITQIDLLENLKSEDLHFSKIKNAIIAKRDAAREEKKLSLLAQGQTLPSYIQVDLALTELEQKAIDLTAFFDGVELYFDPENHTEMLGTVIAQSDRMEIAEYVGSPQLAAAGGRIDTGSFVGIYDTDELNTYMRQLDENVKIAGVDVAFELSQPDHIISICYDSQNDQWWFIDANDLPPVAAAPARIAELIQQAFLLNTEDLYKQKLTGLATQIVGTANNTQKLLALFVNLQQSREFQDLHKLTPEKINRKARGNLSLPGLAASINDSVLLMTLIQLNAPYMDEADSQGHTPVAIAADNDAVACLQILLDARSADGKFLIDLNKSVDGSTAVLLAAQGNYTRSLGILISAREDDGPFRADLDIETKKNLTATYMAVDQNSIASFRMLIESRTPDGKPRVDFRRSFGDRKQTLAHVAAEWGYLVIIKVLEKNNVDMNPKNKAGRTPVQLAKKYRHQEVVDFYEAWGMRRHMTDHLDELFDKRKYSDELINKFEDKIYEEFDRDYKQFLSEEGIASLVQRIQIKPESSYNLFSPKPVAPDSLPDVGLTQRKKPGQK